MTLTPNPPMNNAVQRSGGGYRFGKSMSIAAAR